MKTILCVDDDLITLSICSIVMQKANFCEEIITLNNGKEAVDFYKNLSNQVLEKTEANVPELVFLDLNMPIMNGWDFLDSFEADYLSLFPKTIVYILSSSVDPIDLEKSKSYASVKGFISKPLTKVILANIKAELT